MSVNSMKKAKECSLPIFGLLKATKMLLKSREVCPSWPTDPGGHSIVKNTGGGGAGSIVLQFWFGKAILGFFKNIDLDNS